MQRTEGEKSFERISRTPGVSLTIFIAKKLLFKDGTVSNVIANSIRCKRQNKDFQYKGVTQRKLHIIIRPANKNSTL